MVVGRICGTGEFKSGMEEREEVRDGVMFVTDDRMSLRLTEWQEDYSKDWVMHIGIRKERFVILREEDDGGRVMVMSADERVRPGD